MSSPLHELLPEALELAMEGRIREANRLFETIDKTNRESPKLLWEHPHVYLLGRAYHLMYHFDLREAEADQITYAHLSYWYLSRAWELESGGQLGTFSDFFGSSDQLLSVGRDRITLLENADDALAHTMKDLLTAKETPPADADAFFKDLKKGRLALKLMQFHDLEVMDEHFPDFNEDPVLIEFSNNLEAEGGFTRKDAVVGAGLHHKLAHYIDGRVAAGAFEF